MSHKDRKHLKDCTIYFAIGIALIVLINIAFAGSASTKFPGKTVPAVGDAGTGWATNIRAWMLSVDAELLSPSATSATISTLNVTTATILSGTATIGTLTVTNTVTHNGTSTFDTLVVNRSATIDSLTVNYKATFNNGVDFHKTAYIDTMYLTNYLQTPSAAITTITVGTSATMDTVTVNGTATIDTLVVNKNATLDTVTINNLLTAHKTSYLDTVVALSSLQTPAEYVTTLYISGKNHIASTMHLPYASSVSISGGTDSIWLDRDSWYLTRSDAAYMYAQWQMGTAGTAASNYNFPRLIMRFASSAGPLSFMNFEPHNINFEAGDGNALVLGFTTFDMLSGYEGATLRADNPSITQGAQIAVYADTTDGQYEEGTRAELQAGNPGVGDIRSKISIRANGQNVMWASTMAFHDQTHNKATSIIEGIWDATPISAGKIAGAGTANTTVPAYLSTLDVNNASDFATTVDFGGTAKISKDGYDLLFASHSGMYLGTSGGARTTAATAGAYTTFGGWLSVGNESGAGYAVATTGAISKITIGASGAGTYLVKAQVNFKQSYNGGNNVEGCLFKNATELPNCQDIRSFSNNTDIGRLGAFGFVSLAANDTLTFKVKPWDQNCTITPYRGNFTILRIGP